MAEYKLWTQQVVAGHPANYEPFVHIRVACLPVYITLVCACAHITGEKKAIYFCIVFLHKIAVARNDCWREWLYSSNIKKRLKLVASWEQQQRVQQRHDAKQQEGMLDSGQQISQNPRFLRTWFLNFKSLKRSKSLKFFLCVRLASFWAHAVLFQAAMVSFFSRNFLTVVAPAARGKSLTTKGVKVKRRKACAWRLTPVVGPSIRARLWSTMSTMTASLPASSP